jgi:hypothetical protein
MAVLDEDQVPPRVASDKGIEAPVQTVVAPVIGDTVPVLLTVIAFVAYAEPHELVMV